MSKIGLSFFQATPPAAVTLRSFTSRLATVEDGAAFVSDVHKTVEPAGNGTAPAPNRRRQRWQKKFNQLAEEARRTGLNAARIFDHGGHIIRLLSRQRFIKQVEMVIPQTGTDKLRGQDRLDNPFVVDQDETDDDDDDDDDDGHDGDGFVALDSHHKRALGGTARTISSALGADVLNAGHFYVARGPLQDLLAPEFLKQYIVPAQQGAVFRALSMRTEIDHTNSVCITPDGILIMIVSAEAYARLGLRGVRARRSQRHRGSGKQHKLSMEWFRIGIDLKSEVCCKVRFKRAVKALRFERARVC